MKKLLTLSAILLAGTTQAFFGAGCTLDGDCSAQVNTSRTAKVTIAHGKGASQRDNLYNVKRATRLRRLSTREQKSNLLTNNTAQYRGSKANSEVPTAKVETMIERAWRILREKREAKKLINTQ